MKSSTFILIISIFLFGCNNQSKKQEQLRQQQIKDSIQISNKQAEQAKLKAEQAKRDSINQIEEKTAFSNINFGISKTEFDKKKADFIKNSGGKNLGNFYYKSLDGLFHEEKLYSVLFWGYDVLYDEYDRKMKDSYDALMNILIQRYNNPKELNGLPKWNDMNNGDLEKCANWQFGKKDINVFVRCTGANYSLILWIQRSDISDKISQENEKREKEQNEKAANLL